MSSRFARRAAKFAMSACVALGLCSQAQADGWLFGKKKDCCPTPPCPSVTDSSSTPTPPVVPPPGATPAAEQFGAGESDVAAFGAPNMLGNILQGYRGVTFSYLQAGDLSIANTSGAVNFRNTKIAENNSAIPRDRFSVRFNYFADSLSVAGLGRSPQLSNRSFSQFGTEFGSTAIRVNQVFPQSRSYDSHVLTFQGEKTFGDERFSLEARVPIAATLGSDLDLTAGTLIFPDRRDVVPLVPPTPERTKGEYDTELQDIQLILKSLLWTSDCRKWAASGGLGLTLPTGRDLKVHVVDFSNNVQGDPIRPNGTQANLDLDRTGGFGYQNESSLSFAFDRRERFFKIDNDTYALSPFIAIAGTPTDRAFVNGFAQLDLPLNRSDWSYREVDVDLSAQFNTGNFTVPSTIPGNPPGVFRANPRNGNPVQYANTLHGTIRDQQLLHLDLGGGYWLYTDPHACTLKGIAGILEMHYTTTVQNADIVTVPAFRNRLNATSAPEAFPRLGNIRNRLDILDVTTGATFVLGDSTTLSTAVAFPLKRESDRTYDYELQLHLNYYFGCSARAVTPNF